MSTTCGGAAAPSAMRGVRAHHAVLHVDDVSVVEGAHHLAAAAAAHVRLVSARLQRSWHDARAVAARAAARART